MLRRPLSILVVDDDDGVRDMIQALFEQEGFNVSTAATGWAALDLVAAGAFDLAVVDVRLEGEFDGVDLAQCVRVYQPGLRCLFISGVNHPVTDDPDMDDFVAKPFRHHELLGCVWELLQRKVPDPPLDWSNQHAKRVISAAKIDCLRRKRGADPASDKPASRPVGTRRASGLAN